MDTVHRQTVVFSTVIRVSGARIGVSFRVVTAQLADTPTRSLPARRLDNSRTGHLVDWTSCGLDSWQMPLAVVVLVVIM